MYSLATGNSGESGGVNDPVGRASCPTSCVRNGQDVHSTKMKQYNL